MSECHICRNDLEEDKAVCCKGGCSYCEACLRKIVSNGIYEGKTRDDLLICASCEGEFDANVIENLLSEYDKKRLSINERNRDVWEEEMDDDTTYVHCRECELYWTDMGSVSYCPECSTAICVKCWEEVDECECSETEEEEICEAEIRSSAMIRKCPRCRTPFVKEADGCNHVTCSVCKADLCYFCGMRYIGPSIYDEHFGDDGCPMYSSYEELHGRRADEAIAKSRKDHS
jgi:hypothetical protein